MERLRALAYADAQVGQGHALVASEPDEPSGAFELPHRIAESLRPWGGVAITSATGAHLRAAPSGAYGSIVRQRYVRTSPTIDPFVRCLERTHPRQRIGAQCFLRCALSGSSFRLNRQVTVGRLIRRQRPTQIGRFGWENVARLSRSSFGASGGEYRLWNRFAASTRRNPPLRGGPASAAAR